MKWSLYPNPSSDMVQLKFGQGQEPTKLELRDMRGRQVNPLFTPVGPGHWTLDLTVLETGSYLLTWNVRGMALSTPVHKINP